MKANKEILFIDTAIDEAFCPADIFLLLSQVDESWEHALIPITVDGGNTSIFGFIPEWMISFTDGPNIEDFTSALTEVAEGDYDVDDDGRFTICDYHFRMVGSRILPVEVGASKRDGLFDLIKDHTAMDDQDAKEFAEKILKFMN